MISLDDFTKFSTNCLSALAEEIKTQPIYEQVKSELSNGYLTGKWSIWCKESIALSKYINALLSYDNLKDRLDAKTASAMVCFYFAECIVLCKSFKPELIRIHEFIKELYNELSEKYWKERIITFLNLLDGNEDEYDFEEFKIKKLTIEEFQDFLVVRQA